MNVLYFDIENTPIVGLTWGTYQTDVLSIKKDTELLCFAYKKNDEPIQVISRRLHSERFLARKLWTLFNWADIIVGHNGDNFDIKMANQYFIKYGLTPPSPYKSIDTLKLARKYFRFSQNKLDYISKFLFNERKIHVDLDLWLRCMDGDPDALILMEKYNRRDVDLLYRTYKKIGPWHTGHPNYNVYNGTTHRCPVCGGKTHRRGYSYTRVGKFQRYQCQECAHWSIGERVPVDKPIK